ncbi:MAG: transglutaminase domain-containing protein [Phycisphaerales bacterium]|nr:transglutaminase domain-containing protein [Phycisphaerales bacterium]
MFRTAVILIASIVCLSPCMATTDEPMLPLGTYVQGLVDSSAPSSVPPVFPRWGNCGFVRTTVQDPNWVLAVSSALLTPDTCVFYHREYDGFFSVNPIVGSSDGFYANVFDTCNPRAVTTYYRLAPGATVGVAIDVQTLDGYELRNRESWFVRAPFALLGPSGNSLGTYTANTPIYSSFYYDSLVTSVPSRLPLMISPLFPAGVVRYNTTNQFGGPSRDGLADLGIIIGAEPSIRTADWNSTHNATASATQQYRVQSRFGNRVIPAASSVYEIVRRGVDATEVLLEIDPSFGSGCHQLDLVLQLRDAPGSSSVTLPIQLSSTGTGWRAWEKANREIVGSGPNARLRLRVGLAIPVAAAIGQYDAHIAVRRLIRGDELTRFVLKPLVVLFNPMNPADLCYVASTGDRQRYVFGNDLSYFSTNVHPTDGTVTLPTGIVLNKREANQFTLPVIQGSLRLLTGLSAMARADPALVSRHVLFQASVFETLPEEPLLSEWVDGNMLGLFRPIEMAAYYDRWLNALPGSKTSRAQCFVYSNVLASGLRSLGLAARNVSCTGAANDLNDDGKITRFWRFAGSSSGPTPRQIIRDSDRNIERRWNFHVWTEVFTSRVDQSVSDGWQELDATVLNPITFGAQAPANRLPPAGPAPRTSVQLRRLGGFDVAGFVTRVDAGVENKVRRRVAPFDDFVIQRANRHLIRQVDLNGGPNGADRMTNFVILDDVTPFAARDATLEYRLPIPLPVVNAGTSPQTVIPTAVGLGDDLEFQIILENADPVERIYDVSSHLVGGGNGFSTGEVQPPQFHTVVVPAAGWARLTLTFPAQSLRPLFQTSVNVELSVGAWCEELEIADVLVARTALKLPEHSASVQPEAMRPTGWQRVSSSITAPANSALSNVTVRTGSRGMVVFEGGQTEVVTTIGNIPAGETRQVSLWVRSVVPDDGLMTLNLPLMALPLNRSQVMCVSKDAPLTLMAGVLAALKTCSRT